MFAAYYNYCWRTRKPGQDREETAAGRHDGQIDRPPVELRRAFRRGSTANKTILTQHLALAESLVFSRTSPDFSFVFFSRSRTIRMLSFEPDGRRRTSSLKPSLCTLNSIRSLFDACTTQTSNEPSSFCNMSRASTGCPLFVRLIVAPKIGRPSPSTISPPQVVYDSQPANRTSIRHGETRHTYHPHLIAPYKTAILTCGQSFCNTGWLFCV